MPQAGLATKQTATKDYLVFNKFETMDTQRARAALPPSRLAWCENLQILAENQLLTVPGQLAARNTIPGKVITSQFSASLNGVDYVIAFTSDGGGYQYNIGSAAIVQFAPTNTFSPNPDVAVWQNLRILIADSVAGYSTWDTVVFVQKGGVSPVITILQGGTGYGAPPSVSILGGSGSLASATDTILGGSVATITLNQPGVGYQASDTLAVAFGGTATPGIGQTFVVLNGGSGYTSAPAVTVTGGGASVQATGTAVLTGGVVTSITLNTAGTGYTSTPTVTIGAPPAGGVQAIAQLRTTTVAFATAHVFPSFTMIPTTITIFQGRVWLGGGRILAWTGTAGFDDNNPANASGSQIVSDSDLIHQLTALRSLNNYLYIFGDNSVKQIGAITVSGSTTNFTINTLASDVGTTFPLSVASYNRLVVFANQIGVYAIFGASIEKISDPMDGIFQGNTFTPIPCQAAVINLTAQKTYLLLMGAYADAFTNTTRAVVLAFSAKRWYVLNLGPTVKSLVACPLASGLQQVFASSGPDFTQVLASNLQPVTVRLQTALGDHGKPYMGKRVLRFGVGHQIVGPTTINGSVDTELASNPISYSAAVTVTWLNGIGQVVTWQNNSLQTVTFGGSGFQFVRGPAAGSGIYIGMTLQGTFTGAKAGNAPLSFNSITLEYQEATVFASSAQT